MKTLFLALLILFVLVNRQLKPRPIKGNVLFLPSIIMLYGAHLAYQAEVQSLEIMSLVLTVIMGLGVGWLQGRYTSVYEHNGIWMTAGSIWSVLVWLLSIPIRIIIKYGFEGLFNVKVQLVGEYAYVPFLISLGAIVLGRALYLLYRYPVALSDAAGTTRYERRQARRAK